MNNMPHTPFSTALSRSARETEQRIKQIMSGPKKRPPLPFLLLMFAVCLFCGNLVSCQNVPIDVGSGSAQTDHAQPGEPTVPAAKASAVPGLERRSGVYTLLLTACTGDNAPADTLMVLCYDTQRQTAGLVSLPRDILVHRNGEAVRLYNVPNDPEQTAAAVSYMLGVPIDYYVDVGVDGFVALVDELGGIDFDIPCDMDYDDPSQNLSIHFAAGPAHLSGQQAMEVARFRKSNNGAAYSDLERTQVQRQLVLALAKQLLSWDSMSRINAFVDLFGQNVDTDLSMSDMLYFASRAVGLDLPEDMETAVLPVRGVAQGALVLGLEPDPEPTLALVNRLLNPYTQDLTLEDMHLIHMEF